jgi:hypothetical protein
MSGSQDHPRFVAMNAHRLLARVLLGFTALAAWLGAGEASFAQAIWGQTNVSFSAGDNLFENPLDNSLNGGSNALDAITVDNGEGNVVPDGTIIQPWDSATGQYLPPSVFDASSESWSIAYTLAPGQGAKLDAPSAFSNTFIGYVQEPQYNSSGQLTQGGFDSTSFTFVNPPPIETPGVYLLGCVAPVPPATFQMIVGRDPLVGETVRILDAATQTYSATTFEGSSWNNGAPTLNDVGDAAFFTLMPLGGDALGTGVVDINDLTIVLSNFGNTVDMDWSTGDFNGDGRVDVNDLTILLTNFGQSIGSSAAGASAVPEPSAIVLLGFSMAGLSALFCRRRGAKAQVMR